MKVALRFDPTRHATLALLTNFHKEKGEDALARYFAGRAVKACEHSLPDSQDDIEIYCLMPALIAGLYEENAGRGDKAIWFYETAVKYDQNNAETWQELARLHHEEGHWERTLASAQIACGIEENGTQSCEIYEEINDERHFGPFW